MEKLTKTEVKNLINTDNALVLEIFKLLHTWAVEDGSYNSMAYAATTHNIGEYAIKYNKLSDRQITIARRFILKSLTTVTAMVNDMKATE